MEATQTASNEHLEFDRLCEQVEEFDYLPAVSPSPDAPEPEPEPGEPGERRDLDQLILAGLVSPA